MIRMSKLADYGIVLMTELARVDKGNYSARELAWACHLPVPVVSKILKVLTKEGLLTSQRGVNGGYHLARSAETISVGEIIHAMEGPIAMTECGVDPTDCSQESFCPVQTNWQKINAAIHRVLGAISLSDMLDPLPDPLISLGGLEADSNRNSAASLH